MERAELIALLRATGCAEERNGIFFLGETGAGGQPVPEHHSSDLGWLCVKTGGSSGRAKFARHDEQTLTAAVHGFCQHFALVRVNAVDVLPALHISGLMARVRCAATGGQHVAWDWKKLAAGEVPALAADDWVISLVPTQLHRLMQIPATVTWLRRFRLIFVGGGPLWPELADAAARAGLPLSPSYGMTETAAMIAAAKPADFLAGDRTCGTALPHARLDVTKDGVVRIAGASVFRGYWPEYTEAREFVTEDLGEIDAQGRLRVFGRRDAVIITGGKKVHPADVEAALRASGEFDDVAVIGLPDVEWGERVVACYPRSRTAPDTPRAMAGLAPHERPKQFIAVAAAEWPRNAQGKVNRAALKQTIAQQRQSDVLG